MVVFLNDYITQQLNHDSCIFNVSPVSAAKSKPIVAEPEIHGGQSLDGVTGLLLLMSEGLIKALEAAHGPEQVNQVCSHLHKQFLRTCANLSDVEAGRKKKTGRGYLFLIRCSHPGVITVLNQCFTLYNCTEM